MPLAIRQHSTAGGTVRDSLTFGITDQFDDRYTFDPAGGLTRADRSYVNDIASDRYDHRTFGHLVAQVGRSLPGNATIVSAILQITARGGSTTRYQSRWALERALNPATLTDKSELALPEDGGGRTKTAVLTWEPPQGFVDGRIFTIDLTAQMQEVRALGSAAITSINAFWFPLTKGYGGSNNNHSIYNYYTDPSKSMILTVTYDVPAGV